MISKVLLFVALMAMTEGAVLVRFINTVPTRTSYPSVTLNWVAPAVTTAQNPAAATYSRLTGNGRALGLPKATGAIDRVGLYYYADTGNSVSTPTIVWTQLVEVADVGTTNAPYAWYHAMPPLRGYHAVRAANLEAASIDRPLSASAAADNGGILPNQWDVYEQTRLKADGVGLYLSFAAGTYRFQAYTVMSDLTSIGAGNTEEVAQAHNNPARTFTTSASTFTFEDNKVYTIIAYGTAQYGATVPLTGATVRLTSIEESVASTTFGKAALRFFHAIQTESTNVIDVYTGSNYASTGRILQNVAFGTVSSYVDVNPGLSVEFPLAVPGANIRPVASGITVTRDVRAGLRATVICAVSDESVSNIFCRAIPSRAVAYVRLVNDCAGQNGLVAGRFGAQRLAETSLTLWASYEVPRPEQVYEMSQVVGNSVWTNHPATTEGLYPVVKNVVPNSVSGYGEVFVPLFIMDYAVRFVIGANHADRAAVDLIGANGGSSTMFIAAAGPQTWYWFAPMLKRVHFVLKTDGMATLTGRTDNLRNAFPFVDALQVGKNNPTFTGLDVQTTTPNRALTLDEYIEPGQYYTIFASASNTALNDAGAATINFQATTPNVYQDAGAVELRIRLDRTVAKVAEGVASGRGILTLVPFASDILAGGAAINQAFNAAPFAFSLTQGTTQISPAIATVGVNLAVAFAAGATPVDNTIVSNLIGNAGADTTDIVLTAGTYMWSSTPGADTCLNNIPGGGSITIAEGTITDIFVLNTFACRTPAPSTNPSLLKVVTAVRSSAAATGNSPSATTTTRRAAEASVPLYNAASSAAASVLLALFAAALALFAL